MAKCTLCGKEPIAGNNVPNSLHKTRRLIRPNVQKVNGILLCTRCLRTIKNVGRTAKLATPVPQTPVTA